MIVGDPMPAPWDTFRYIDADQHQIGRRMKEMDPDCALVINTENDELAIARRVPELERVTGSVWTIARYLPFKGEPDGRILQVMRESDNRRVKNLRQWSRDLKAGMRRSIERDRKDSLRVHMEHAEREVYRHSRVDVGIKPTISVPKAVK